MSSHEQRMQQTSMSALGTGWPTFAGVLMLASGVWGVIEGIAGLAKNHYFAPQAGDTFFWSRPFWGVVLLIVGGMALYAGFAVLNRMPGARVIAVGVAALGLIVQLMVVGANQTWAQAGIAIDLVLLYGLIARGEGATGPPV